MAGDKQSFSTNQEGRFMVAMGAIIENTKTGKILLAKRHSKNSAFPDLWEDITGRMKQFEEPEEGLRREVKEETGLDITEIVKPLTVFHFFRGEEVPELEVIGMVFWVKTDQEEVTISQEHQEFRWLTPQQALELVDHPGITRDIQAFIHEKSKEN